MSLVQLTTHKQQRQNTTNVWRLYTQSKEHQDHNCLGSANKVRQQSWVFYLVTSWTCEQPALESFFLFTLSVWRQKRGNWPPTSTKALKSDEETASTAKLKWLVGVSETGTNGASQLLGLFSARSFIYTQFVPSFSTKTRILRAISSPL